MGSRCIMLVVNGRLWIRFCTKSLGELSDTTIGSGACAQARALGWKLPICRWSRTTPVVDQGFTVHTVHVIIPRLLSIPEKGFKAPPNTHTSIEQNGVVLVTGADEPTLGSDTVVVGSID